MLVWNGIPSDDTIVVCCRPDQDTVNITLTVDGFTPDVQASAHATDDGVVRLEVTGLAADTMYEYTVSSSGTEDDVVLKQRTFPSSGPIKLATASCQGGVDFAPGRTVVREGARALIHTGDESYDEDDAFPTLAAALDQASHYDFHRQHRGGVGWKGHSEQETKHWMWAQGVGFAIVVDDHDHFYNDGIDDLADMIAYCAAARDASYNSATEANWTTIKANAYQAIKSYSKGNPINTDPEAEAGALYFRFEAGDAEVFVLSEVISGPNYMRPDWGAGNELLSPEQQDWLQTRLALSEKRHKVIFAPKCAIAAHYNNPDTWRKYDDMLPMLEWISDNVPGTVTWLGGDYHSAGMFASKTGIPEGNQFSSQGLEQPDGTKGFDFNCFSLCASSSGRHSPHVDDGVPYRCDVRDSDKDQLGPNDVTLYACTDDNGRAGDRNQIGVGFYETLENNRYAKAYMLNTASRLLFEGYNDAVTQQYTTRDLAMADVVAGFHPTIENRLAETADIAQLILDARDGNIVNGSAKLTNNLSWHLAVAGDYVSALGHVGWNPVGLDVRNGQVGLYSGTIDGGDVFTPDALVAQAQIDFPGEFQTAADAAAVETSVNIPLTPGTYYLVAATAGGDYALTQLNNHLNDSNSGSGPTDTVLVKGTFNDPWTEDAASSTYPVTYAIISNDGVGGGNDTQDKTDFIGTHVVSTTVRDLAITAGGKESQQMFNLMAAYGQTTTTPPLTLAQMAQTYIIPDMDAVNAILRAGGVRGHQFLSVITLGRTP